MKSESALAVLRHAKAEVAELIAAERVDEVAALAEQLVPYAEAVAKAEGHGDFTRVLERELDL